MLDQPTDKKYRLILRLGGKNPFHMTFQLEGVDDISGVWGFVGNERKGLLGYIFRDGGLEQHQDNSIITRDERQKIIEDFMRRVSKLTDDELKKFQTTPAPPQPRRRHRGDLAMPGENSKEQSQPTRGAGLQRQSAISSQESFEEGDNPAPPLEKSPRANKLLGHESSEGTLKELRELQSLAREGKGAQFLRKLNEINPNIRAALLGGQDKKHEAAVTSEHSDYATAKEIVIELTAKQAELCKKALTQETSSSFDYFVLGRNCIFKAFELLKKIGVDKEERGKAVVGLIGEKSHSFYSSLATLWLGYSVHRLVFDEDRAITTTLTRIATNIVENFNTCTTAIGKIIEKSIEASKPIVKHLPGYAMAIAEVAVATALLIL